MLLAIKNSLSFQPKPFLDEGGRYITVSGDINFKPYTVVTLFALNSHQLRFIRKVLKKANSVKYRKFLVCGDFNLTSDLKMDFTTSKPNGMASLHALLHTAELFDTWRFLRANEKNYIFFSHRHHSYIDMFLTDKWLLQQVATTQIHDIMWSDHAAISMSLKEQGVSSSSPIWRCNVILL